MSVAANAPPFLLMACKTPVGRRSMSDIGALRMLRVTKPVFLSTSRLKRGSSYGAGTCSTWLAVNAAPTMPAVSGTRISLVWSATFVQS